MMFPLTANFLKSAQKAFDFLLTLSPISRISSVFLFFFLGRRAWLGRDFKVPKAVEKAEENVGNFFTAYRNTLGDRNAPLKTRILLFSLMFAPLFALAIFLIVAVEELLWLGCIGLVVFTVCTLIWAKRIFGKKK